MEKEENKVVEISAHGDFTMVDAEESIAKVETAQKMTNPITKNFVKFSQRLKDKFDIKDILR